MTGAVRTVEEQSMGVRDVRRLGGVEAWYGFHTSLGS